MNHRKVDTREVEAHNLVNHRELEVGLGVINRHTASLDKHNDNEYIGNQQQYDSEVGIQLLRHREDVGKRRVAAEERQCCHRHHQRRLDQCAVERLTGSTHTFERATCIHRSEDKSYTREGEQVCNKDNIAVERADRLKICHWDKQKGNHRSTEIDTGCDAEQKGSGGRVYRALAQLQANIHHMLEETNTLTTRQHSACAVDNSRNRECYRNHNQSVK